jgi:hypothetical protein
VPRRCPMPSSRACRSESLRPRTAAQSVSLTTRHAGWIGRSCRRAAHRLCRAVRTPWLFLLLGLGSALTISDADITPHATPRKPSVVERNLPGAYSTYG